MNDTRQPLIQIEHMKKIFYTDEIETHGFPNAKEVAEAGFRTVVARKQRFCSVLYDKTFRQRYRPGSFAANRGSTWRIG